MYGNKGKNIPPPSDRIPDTSGYRQMDPSADAHIIHDAPDGYHQQYNMT